MLLACAPWSSGYARRVYPIKHSVVVMKEKLETVGFVAVSADGRWIASGDGHFGDAVPTSVSIGVPAVRRRRRAHVLWTRRARYFSAIRQLCRPHP
jgi:hypothetical protein